MPLGVLQIDGYYRLVVRNAMRASRSLVVAVKTDRLVLPRYDDEDDVPLDLAGLLAVEGLAAGTTSLDDLAASVAGRTGRPVDDVAEVLHQIEARGLVASGEPDHGEPAEPVATPAATIEALDDLWVLPNPLLLGCHPSGFEYADHDGRLRARLNAVELLAVTSFGQARTRDDAFEAHQAQAGSLALSAEAFDDLLRRSAACSLIVRYQPGEDARRDQAHQAEAMRDAIRRQFQVQQAFDELEQRADESPGPPDRVKVVGVHTNWTSAPASLGLLVAHAKAYDSGRLQESYDFRPRLLFDDERLTAMAQDPGIFLFSNYVWSTERNLELSALVKRVSPHSITIHGGPNTPKYERDTAQFFADHPHVDVAVHGEGEATFAEMLDALRGHVGDGPPDLSVLGDVAGLTFRLGARAVRTGDRDRIAELDTIPSPILTGLFDGFIPAGPLGGVVLETNRGCPYGCTFCDWGSATLSRIRKFDLDRIFAELEWCAHHQVHTVGIADANFGIFERDVQIAEKIAELKREFGYPQYIGNNYAKNTVKHLSKIIELFTEVGIVAEGKMSMQSMDEGTLATIRRKNIKVEKYDELSAEFRKNRLPLSVDLMLGLPGSTPDTLRNDMQECIRRDVRVALHPTMLLPNSPMNDPEYRQEHGITAKPGEFVRETSTYTRDEWDQMYRLTAGFWLFENFGILRQVAMYVHADTGGREVDFYERLIEDATSDPERWPHAATTLRVLPKIMVPPVSWKRFLDEVQRHLIDVERIPDDDALDTVLRVQHALLPSRDRSFPELVELPHDYVQWHQLVLQARNEGHGDDWHKVVPPLRELPPGQLRVDDPHDICTTALDGSLLALVTESSWDFDSAVSRPRQRLAQSA